MHSIYIHKYHIWNKCGQHVCPNHREELHQCYQLWTYMYFQIWCLGNVYNYVLSSALVCLIGWYVQLLL